MIGCRISPEKAEKMKKYRDKGLTYEQIGQLFNVNMRTAHMVLKRLKDREAQQESPRM